MKVFESVFLVLALMTGVAAHGNHPASKLEPDIETIVPKRITRGDDIPESNFGNLRSLQEGVCNPDVYEYTATIRDDLIMSYVVTNRSFSVELRYTGEAWIGLGISPDGRGKMVGSQAWIALPKISSKPAIYDLNAKRLSGVVFGKNQTLVNGTATQTGGITTMRLKKLLNDGPVNDPVNGNGENVFIWAFGSGNTLGKHKRRGAFRIQLTPCAAVVVDPPKPVETSVVCGLFSFSLLCPIASCGPLIRLFGLCG
jgi:hypothetical protein